MKNLTSLNFNPFVISTNFNPVVECIFCKNMYYPLHLDLCNCDICVESRNKCMCKGTRFFYDKTYKSNFK